MTARHSTRIVVGHGQEKRDLQFVSVGSTIIKNLILGGGILRILDAPTILKQIGEVLLISMSMKKRLNTWVEFSRKLFLVKNTGAAGNCEFLKIRKIAVSHGHGPGPKKLLTLVTSKKTLE
jgi:hypothetical protein